ncbi:DUF2997 domain-containing protein [bacterium]|nr:DUF2997 domain-containing protein [bacterium]
MAVKKELIIEISADGTLKIKTEGFKGSECEEELKPIERALGTVTERTRTSEFYQQKTTQKRRVSNSTE